MHSKTRIAALIAALALGAQAGIAAIEETEVSEPVQAVEPTAVETLPAYQADAATPESVAPSEAAAAEPNAPSVPATAPAQSAQPEQSTIRGWFASLWDRIVSAFRSAPAALRSVQAAFLSPTPPSVFPQGSDSGEAWKPLPAQLAYLEQVEQQRTYLASTGSAFPEGSDGEELPTLLPAQIAYFDRLEQQRLASLQPQPAPQAEIQPAAVEAGAPAGSTELTMAHDTAVSAMR